MNLDFLSEIDFITK